MSDGESEANDDELPSTGTFREAKKKKTHIEIYYYDSISGEIKKDKKSTNISKKKSKK